MSTVRDITGYRTSRDYERLADLMQKQSVVCIVDCYNCRDVAQTLWTESADGEGFWQVSARGLCYIYSCSRSEFVAACWPLRLEFLTPNVDSSESPEPDTLPAA